jgi:hypothetical protein
MNTLSKVKRLESQQTMPSSQASSGSPPHCAHCVMLPWWILAKGYLEVTNLLYMNQHLLPKWYTFKFHRLELRLSLNAWHKGQRQHLEDSLMSSTPN